MSSALSKNSEALKRMRKLVNSLLSRNDCHPFAEPVDWRGLELWDYPKIIKKRMDLGTVKRKLERTQYRNHKECADDIRLVWTNCMTYNQEGSDFFVLAKNFSRRFEDRYKKIVAEFGEPSEGEEDQDEDEQEYEWEVNDSGTNTKRSASQSRKRTSAQTANVPTSASLDIKARFASRLFYLSGIELAHVITTLELNCPEALEMVRGQPAHMEIDVDAMDARIFAELDAYVFEKVGTQHDPTPVIHAAATTASTSSSRTNKKRRSK